MTDLRPERDWCIKYWTNELVSTTEYAKPILNKLFETPYAPLTTEELHRVRSVLMEYNSFSRLLAADVARPDPTPTPLWKKLFRKK